MACLLLLLHLCLLEMAPGYGSSLGVVLCCQGSSLAGYCFCQSFCAAQLGCWSPSRGIV
jgi:hypothetical protein